jgi:hypothetical protein
MFNKMVFEEFAAIEHYRHKTPQELELLTQRSYKTTDGSGSLE